MLANEVTGCLAHGYDVQLTMLGDVVCVFPVYCTKPAETATCRTIRMIYLQMVVLLQRCPY